MGRAVETIEGLAVLGTGTVGPLTVPLPGLLFAGGNLPSEPM